MALQTDHFANDRRPDIRPIYGYIIRQVDADDVPNLFLVRNETEIDVSNLPARYDADDPQAFVPANITHGELRRESNFDKSAFEIQALTSDIEGISRYAMTGALPRIKVDVVKFNPGPNANGKTTNWTKDAMIVQRGLMASFTFQGFGVSIECVPEPLFSGHEVPRWRFSRTCNRQLYGPGCNVDKEAFELASNIVELERGKRAVTISDQHPDDDGNFFRQGVMIHQPTGMRFSIFKSTKVAGGKTRLKLHQWNPDFAETDVVVIRPGCRHTLADCRDKFDNAANFGGFSQVPNKNPSIHGL